MGIMKKNMLYRLSSILIIISLFASAVTCNLCGTPIDIATSEEEITEAESETESETSTTTQVQTQSTEITEEGNHPPEIIEMETMGMDVELAVSEGYFYGLLARDVSGEEFIFTVEAQDEDGDGLQYRAYDDLGTNFDVTKTDNNNAEFIWIVPGWGPHTLTIEVSDGKGGTDLYPIDMLIVLEAPEVGEPGEPADEGVGGPSEGATSIVAEQSGTVYENDRVMVSDHMSAGDTDDNLQMKGYLGFDISKLHGKTVLAAEINLSHLAHAQFPGLFASFLVVRVFDFEDSLDASDFEPGGVTIANIPINSASYIISGDTLVDELQKVLDDLSRDYFQIKLGLDVKTNNNGDADYIYIYNYEATLYISYLD